MGTSKDYIDYVLECLSHIEGISARQMFGEYALYMFNRVMGVVCDDQVFLKILPASTKPLLLKRPVIVRHAVAYISV